MIGLKEHLQKTIKFDSTFITRFRVSMFPETNSGNKNYMYFWQTCLFSPNLCFYSQPCNIHIIKWPNLQNMLTGVMLCLTILACVQYIQWIDPQVCHILVSWIGELVLTTHSEHALPAGLIIFPTHPANSKYQPAMYWYRYIKYSLNILYHIILCIYIYIDYIALHYITFHYITLRYIIHHII